MLSSSDETHLFEDTLRPSLGSFHKASASLIGGSKAFYENIPVWAKLQSGRELQRLLAAGERLEIRTQVRYHPTPRGSQSDPGKVTFALAVVLVTRRSWVQLLLTEMTNCGIGCSSLLIYTLERRGSTPRRLRVRRST